MEFTPRPLAVLLSQYGRRRTVTVRPTSPVRHETIPEPPNYLVDCGSVHLFLPDTDTDADSGDDDDDDDDNDNQDVYSDNLLGGGQDGGTPGILHPSFMGIRHPRWKHILAVLFVGAAFFALLYLTRAATFAYSGWRSDSRDLVAPVHDSRPWSCKTGDGDDIIQLLYLNIRHLNRIHATSAQKWAWCQHGSELSALRNRWLPMWVAATQIWLGPLEKCKGASDLGRELTRRHEGMGGHSMWAWDRQCRSIWQDVAYDWPHHGFRLIGDVLDLHDWAQRASLNRGFDVNLLDWIAMLRSTLTGSSGLTSAVPLMAMRGFIAETAAFEEFLQETRGTIEQVAQTLEECKQGMEPEIGRPRFFTGWLYSRQPFLTQLLDDTYETIISGLKDTSRHLAMVGNIKAACEDIVTELRYDLRQRERDILLRLDAWEATLRAQGNLDTSCAAEGMFDAVLEANESLWKMRCSRQGGLFEL